MLSHPDLRRADGGRVGQRELVAARVPRPRCPGARFLRRALALVMRRRPERPLRRPATSVLGRCRHVRRVLAERAAPLRQGDDSRRERSSHPRLQRTPRLLRRWRPARPAPRLHARNCRVREQRPGRRRDCVAVARLRRRRLEERCRRRLHLLARALSAEGVGTVYRRAKERLGLARARLERWGGGEEASGGEGRVDCLHRRDAERVCPLLVVQADRHLRDLSKVGDAAAVGGIPHRTLPDPVVV
mmetsp:Transcript_19592/g.57596  ORF Transcript_19592/g.57596 Transcript_19592/m.57596 type:complete len:245 (+) Transcript_19592:2175-2909(+)